MKITPGIMLTIAIAFMAYGYWGAFTESGNKVYDEMDAMLPFFGLVLGAVLFIIFVVIMIVIKNRKRKTIA